MAGALEGLSLLRFMARLKKPPMGANFMSAAGSLRRMIDGDSTVVAPSCFDPLSARIIQRKGFGACYLGGYSTGAHSAITEPMLSLTDMVALSRSVTGAVKIPLIVDADSGFGDPSFIPRMVREFERAGVAGIHIEDQVYPKRFHYHAYSTKKPARTVHVVPMVEMLEKLKIALEARDDPDFVIIARTDAFASSGLAEAVRRCAAYRKAGADLVMSFPTTEADLSKVSRTVGGRLVYVNTEARPRPYLRVQQAQKLGVRVLIYALTATYVTSLAVSEVYDRLKKTGDTGLGDHEMEAAKDMVEELIGLPELYELEERTGRK